MADTDWSVVENETDINESWTKFYNILNGVIELCVPVCKRRSHRNNKSKWWNSQIQSKLLKKKKKKKKKKKPHTQ